MKKCQEQKVNNWNVLFFVVVNENFASLTHHKQTISDPQKSTKSKNYTPEQIQEMKNFIESNLYQYVLLVNIHSPEILNQI